nr:MAG TPA: hypothetical protein [Microviridae sp.]
MIERLLRASLLLYLYRKPRLRPASEGAPLTSVAGNRLRTKCAKSSVSHLIYLSLRCGLTPILRACRGRRPT